MKSFFKNAVDEIARRRIDQIEMEMTQNPAQYPEFVSALRELDRTDNSTAYAQELAIDTNLILKSNPRSTFVL